MNLVVVLLRWLICVAWTFTALTLAQTSTSCNPTEKACPADTALSSSTYTHDFTQGADTSNWNTTAGSISYTSSGAEFTVSKSGDAPTIQSKWYILFGRVSFHIRAAPGTGIVSSAILQSDDLDELDWEWIGGSADKVQTNYFGKGNTTTYDRAQWSAATNTQSVTRNYTITWTDSATTWYIDNTAIRTLSYTDALNGENYPQTPMNLRIGIWAGGDSSNNEGTIEWAGGETDYDDGPFTMVLEKIEVVNEMPGSRYTYGDLTGDWESIVVESGGEVSKKASSSVASSTPSLASRTSVGSETSMGSGTATTTAMEMWWTASAQAVVDGAKESAAGELEVFGMWKLGLCVVLLVCVR